MAIRKFGALGTLCCLTVACTGVPARTPTAATTLMARSIELPPAPVEEPNVTAESSPVEEVSPAEDGLDPLAVNGAFEEEAIPATAITPAARVRKKTVAQLKAALQVVTSATTVDAAAHELLERLGEPTWTEAPKSSPISLRRIWVAEDRGLQCHRLVLEPDGSVVVEGASKAEWRMLTAGSRQNPCTGEIRRGSLQ